MIKIECNNCGKGLKVGSYEGYSVQHGQDVHEVTIRESIEPCEYYLHYCCKCMIGIYNDFIQKCKMLPKQKHKGRPTRKSIMKCKSHHDVQERRETSKGRISNYATNSI